MCHCIQLHLLEVQKLHVHKPDKDTVDMEAEGNTSSDSWTKLLVRHSGNDYGKCTNKNWVISW